MRFLFVPAVLLLASQAFAADFSKFKTQEIDAGLKIGYAVLTADINGDGKPEIVHVPLQGKGATAKGNFTDGRPVRVIALKIPAKDPEKKENWKVQVLSEELHVCHNFWPTYPGGPAHPNILVTSYEGVYVI